MTQLDEKRQETEDSRPRWLVAVAAAAVVILIGVVTVLVNQSSDEQPPPATDPAPSTTLAAQGSDPTGYWVVDEVRQLALLEDGTYFWITIGNVSDTGTWSDDGSVMTFTSGPNSSSCEEGASGQVRYTRTDSGELLVTFVADECFGERDIAPLNGTRAFAQTEPFERPDAALDPWDELLPVGVGRAGQVKIAGFLPETAISSDGSITTGPVRVTTTYAGLYQGQAETPFLSLFQLNDTTISAQLDRFANPELFTSTEPEQVDVGSVSGFRLTVSVDTATTFRSFDNGTWVLDPSTDYLMYFVEVDGTPVALVGDLSAAEADYVTSVVDSIVWRNIDD